VKRIIIGVTVLLAAVTLSAWSLRPAFNKPTGFSFTLRGAGTNIPPAYCNGDIDDGTVLFLCKKTGLANKGYSHIAVLNQTLADISLVTSEDTSTAPSSTSGEKLYVASGGGAAWDDISVFDAIYVMSESGSSVISGKVKVTVW